MSIKTFVGMDWKGQEVKIQGKKVAGRSIYEVGLIIEGQAKALAPIKTGRLAGSITTQQSTGSPHGLEAPATMADIPDRPQSENEVIVGTNVNYSQHVEYGTVNMDAQPFLRPAFDLAQGKVVEIVQRESKLHFKEYLLQHDEYLRSKGK
jgi:HK97 gp10 family phage protein